MFVTLKVFKLIGPSNDGRRHGRGTYLDFFAFIENTLVGLDYLNALSCYSFSRLNPREWLVAIDSERQPTLVTLTCFFPLHSFFVSVL
jgi:hypothetical protein